MSQVLSDPKYIARRVPGPVNHRYAEQEWLRQHENEYRGEWVALQGSELIAHGTCAEGVFETAKKLGFKTPLMHHIQKEPELPFGGW